MRPPAARSWLNLADIGITPASVATVLLLSLAGQIGYFGFLLLLKALMDATRASSNADTYIVMIAIFVGLTLFSEVYLFYRARMLRAAAHRFNLRLRAEALQSSVRNAVRTDVAQGVTVLQDIATVQGFLAGPTLVGALDLVGAFLALAALFYIDSGFGWITTAGILVTIAMAFVTKSATSRQSAQAEGRIAAVSAELGSNFSGNDVLRGLGQLPAMLFRWNRRYDQALDAGDAVHTRKEAIEQIEHIVSGLFVLALLVHGIILAFEGTGTMGLVLCAFFGASKAMAPFSDILRYWDSWSGGLGAWHRLRQVLREDGAPAVAPPDPAAPSGLVAEGLRFWPEGREAPIINDLSLRLPPGSVTLVTGRNGAGKSTLLRLVLGLLQPGSGRVLLNGQDTWFCDRESLGGRIGYLPQDIQLLDETVRTNIGRSPDAPLAAVIAAAGAVGVHEMIGRLPLGYSTPCASLSTGQRRLVALARALYGGPELLVLDEPEEALDGPSRRLLFAAVEHVRMAGGVVLVVTHDPEGWVEQAHHTLHLAPGGQWSLAGQQPLEVAERPIAAVPLPVQADPRDGRLALRQLIEASVPGPPVSAVMRTALLVLGLTLVPFIGWATMTRMEQAVLAQGQLVPDGRRKTINLLEPGILREVLVHEGAVVPAEQPLLRFDVTQSEAIATQARAAYWGGRARAARLAAEQADRRRLSFQVELEAKAAADPAIAVVLQAEQTLFAARWAAFDGQVAVRDRAIAQLHEQVAGARAQRDGAVRQAATVREQIAGYSRLLSQGYASRFLVLTLQQQEAGFVATISQAEAKEAQIREGIVQAEQELAGLRLQRLSDIASDIQATEAAIATAQQQLRTAEDVLTRREVLAPVAGRVTNIRFLTLGASIGSGEPILDLVPIEDRLVAELRVLSTDVDQVKVGQRARLRLTAIRHTNPSMLLGQVITVSPDVQTDAAALIYYLVRVELDPTALNLMPQRTLVAGVPVEGFLLGESRTPLGYFWEPVRGSVRRTVPMATAAQ